MFEIIKNVIESKDYKLEDMLYKINKMYIESAITEQNKTELDRLARENAKAENSYASEQEQINDLFERVTELGLRVNRLEGIEPEEPEEYPEFVQPSNAIDCYNTGDKITFKGKRYICKMNSCIWSPELYPQGWEEVIENTEEKGE